jgi:hypothetical protein
MTALARATPRLLIYSATTGFRHTSIPFAIDALQNSTKEHNLLFDATEDESWFTDEKLSQYDAVVFLSTTGEGTRFSRKNTGLFIECSNVILLRKSAR